MSRLLRTIVVGVASLDGQDPGTGHGAPDPVLAPAVRLAAERAVGAVGEGSPSPRSSPEAAGVSFAAG